MFSRLLEGLKKFAGSRDDGMLEGWIGDATRAIAGQTNADTMDCLLYHLDSVAKEEVRLRPAEERASPAAVFKVLQKKTEGSRISS